MPGMGRAYRSSAPTSMASHPACRRSSELNKCWTADSLAVAIVLAAAASQDNAAIARQLGVCTDTVRKWRRRFAEGRWPRAGRCPAQRAPSIFYRHRPGRGHRAGVRAAGQSGVPLSRWSGPDLARELGARRQLAVSASTIRRGLADDALKPWQHRSWISVRDPQFAAKAARVLDLYAGMWDGLPLGAGDYVICADEKTSIQARCRCHPTLPPGKARAMRVGHDYDRGGALAYLAAWDVHRGRVAGARTPPGSRRSPAGSAGDDHRAGTPAPAGCSGSQTMAPPTAAPPPSNG